MSRSSPSPSPLLRALTGAWAVAAVWGGLAMTPVGTAQGAQLPSRKVTPIPQTLNLRVAAATTPATDEAAQLRAELARVNVEIDALKRAERGTRDEARLRARLADAEALARRLTTLERNAGTPTPAAPAVPAPASHVAAAPGDGPSEWDAKADILADRSRRVAAATAALESRLGSLERRQELKRRAGQLEHDPFAAFETSKRHVVVNGPLVGNAPLNAPASNSDSAAHNATPQNAGGAERGAPGAANQGPVSGTTLSNDSTKGATPAAGGPPSILTPSPAAVESSPVLSLQLRDALDPATLGDIRRLEGTGQGADRLRAYARAIAALKAQQAALDAEAASLRAKARAGGSP
ncbi:MAG TPA: hypothetical protein VIU64_24210 [Polyangia bacterium]